MADQIVIAVDAVGGDKGSGVVVEGVLSALGKDPGIRVILVGPEDVVVPAAAQHERIDACIATESIAMDEHPAQAVRKKKDSSIVVGNRLVREGKAQGFYSPGSTGACLAAATLVVGRIKGVSRPALCTVLPSPKRPVVLCDVGANADCKPSYLVQFAQMATVYAQIALDIEAPRVALLNIGEEDTKGSQLAQESFALLRQEVPAFIGNAEGNDLLDGPADVYVTDGFTGNVALKTLEGTAKVLMGEIKSVMTAGVLTKLGALAMKDGLTRLKASMSSDTYGAAPLLGVKGVCMVGHGSSGPEAVESSLFATAKCIRLDMPGRISQLVRQGSEEAQGSEASDAGERLS